MATTTPDQTTTNPTATAAAATTTQPTATTSTPTAGGTNTNTDTSAATLAQSGNTSTAPASSNNNSAIANLYQQYLGRAPTQSELSFYNSALANGTSMTQLQTDFTSSPEYKSDISSGKINTQTGQYNNTVTQANVASTVGNGVNNPTLPTGTQVNPVTQTSNPNELVSNSTVGVGTNAQTAQTATGTNATASTVNNTATDTTDSTSAQQAASQAGQYQASLIDPNSVPQVQAATGTVDANSTVAGQYDNLTAGVDNGAVPDWAKAAVAATNAQMAARGLGSSTMAASANTAAILQAALPIAQQDAQTNANMQIENLNNEQQAAITNTNNSFQAMLSDQSVTNAAAQFNATSQSQVDEYFANLKSQQAQYNASQVNAMSQYNATAATSVSEQNAQTQTATSEYNVGQANAMSQFNANLSSQQAQFNASNQLVVDQSNATWQRQINTANTASENAANQINAQDALSISNTDLNNLWQSYRDNASYAFQAAQNSSNQGANLALAALNNSANSSLLDQAQLNQMASSLGSLSLNILGKTLTS